MIRISTLVALFAVMPAGAQTLKKGDLSYTAPSCIRVEKGTADCRLTVTYTGKDEVGRDVVTAVATRAYGPDGQTYISVMGLADGDRQDGAFAIRLPRGVPVQVIYRFADLPGQLTAFRALSLNNGLTFQNVQFRSQTQTTQAVTPPTGNILVGADIRLSRCTFQGTTYTCTATLTPTR